MKKQLLCTSAIALGVAAAAPASAQDWNLDWGGFYNQHIAFGDISAGDPALATTEFDGDSLDLHQTAEIIFTPSVTLDNGLTFGVNIQIEGQNGTNIDESYMSISSDTFGRLDVGSENSAGYKMMTGAPSVHSMFINSPSSSAFIPFTGTGTDLGFRQAGLSSYTEVAGNNDVPRITYYTPSFNGLTLGVSYAPEGTTNAGSSYSLNRNAVLTDIFDIGVGYSQSFGAADVTLAARWGTGNTPTVAAPTVPQSDPETWGIGFNVGFNGITIGGSYNESDNDDGLVATGGFGDSEGWSFGVSYDAPGPWSFSAETFQSETDLVNVAGGKLDREAYAIAASRDLGPGVDWDIYVVMEERDNNQTAFTDVEGTVLGTAINLSF
ncbi:MAG: porin [Alphaproteobacteria bacterium]|nr:porin [Alphaproteobacteria bacterium]